MLKICILGILWDRVRLGLRMSYRIFFYFKDKCTYTMNEEMKYASLTAKSLRSIGGLSEVGGISEEILDKLAQDATYRIRMLLQVVSYQQQCATY